jgi:hypothetical protein
MDIDEIRRRAEEEAWEPEPPPEEALEWMGALDDGLGGSRGSGREGGGGGGPEPNPARMAALEKQGEEGESRRLEWNRIWRKTVEHLLDSADEETLQKIRRLNEAQVNALLIDYALGEEEDTPELLGVERIEGFREYADETVEGSLNSENATADIVFTCHTEGTIRLGELLHGVGTGWDVEAWLSGRHFFPAQLPWKEGFRG